MKSERTRGNVKIARSPLNVAGQRTKKSTKKIPITREDAFFKGVKSLYFRLSHLARDILWVELPIDTLTLKIGSNRAMLSSLLAFLRTFTHSVLIHICFGQLRVRILYQKVKTERIVKNRAAEMLEAML